MNELRFILLAIGILVILVIYLWETSRRKKQIRSRIDNYPSSEPEQKSLSPVKGRENQSDISAALKQISHYLRQSKPGANESLAVESGDDNKNRDVAGSNKSDDDGQEIIALYIISNNPSGISGPDILHIMESIGMVFGEMNIFHYFDDQAVNGNPLFSLANIHEPGVFNMQNIAGFSTTGVVMFLCLSEGSNGKAAFEKMLETARDIAASTEGQLCDKYKSPLDSKRIDELRAIASKYQAVNNER
ncbi:MAG: cell division protein ZipA [Gammaproteobacteria bacterium]|nr:cell division protein ZipA [Gammaproteobacteria bacterium]NIN62053.1 cell division protein ZipA [Gammaproteobacteria bacterium]NIO62132.1 cell division protein ZipA [Gammaproteobacteria bacterium]NIQ08258.1 cell division protein ZipA [Gammaproteobacteria bacterium]NIQ19844.1 cell division protein ZipA [Gammaproteobacteria bacterium]